MARFRKNFGGDEELEKRYYDALERAKKYAKLIKEGKLMSNQPVAYVNNMCNDSIDWKVDPIKLEEGTPLYADSSKEMIEMIDSLKKENELLRKRFGEELDAHHSALRKLSKLRKAQEK